MSCFTDSGGNGPARVYYFFLALITPLCLFSCSTAHYKEKADEETYQILQEKKNAVPGADDDFSIETKHEEDPLAAFPKIADDDESLGEGFLDEKDFSIITLEEAVILATQYNRAYQSTKESLFLKALTLTIDRHRYDPIFSGGASGNYKHATKDIVTPSQFTQAIKATRSVQSELESLTGTPAALISQYADIMESAGDLAGFTEPNTHIVDENSLSADTEAKVSLLMKGGGQIALGITTNFLRYLTGNPREAASSAVAASLTQPLLQGSGKAAREHLTQSERDVLYALRDYTQYRKEFAVKIASSYYGVLQGRDKVRNTWRGLQNFRKNLEREKAFVEEGLTTQVGFGRLKQSELDTTNSYTNAVRTYQESIDEFKILLGLSTDTKLTLDDREMDTLRNNGLIHPKISPEDAIQVALVSRLDYANDQEQVEDAERKVDVAENTLLPQVDVVAQAHVNSRADHNQISKLDMQRMSWNVGLDVDPVFDRKSVRNAYRSALISLESAKRNRSLSEDNIKLQVREAWRNLEQARSTYEYALESVKLGERRVEEQNLMAELGQATPKDQIDAQNDLIDAQNALTAALIGHTMARLGFWRDMGLLFIKKDGRWEELQYDPAKAPQAGQ